MAIAYRYHGNYGELYIKEDGSVITYIHENDRFGYEYTKPLQGYSIVDIPEGMMLNEETRRYLDVVMDNEGVD